MKTNDTLNLDRERNINITAALTSGFIASAISSLVLILTTSLALIPQFDFVAIQGSIFGLTSTAISAWVIYFVIGTFLWGLLYPLIEPYLGAKTPAARGALFGIIIWIIVMVALMPLAQAGFFLKEYGFGAAAIVLLTDLVFGASIGHFYNKLRRR